MADVIKTWKTGDVINAEDMNRVEANSANAMSLSKTNETDIDKATWHEVGTGDETSGIDTLEER